MGHSISQSKDHLISMEVPNLESHFYVNELYSRERENEMGLCHKNECCNFLGVFGKVVELTKSLFVKSFISIILTFYSESCMVSRHFPVFYLAITEIGTPYPSF